MLPKLRERNYEMRLRECGLTKLQNRRLRGDQIKVFEISNGYDNIATNAFFLSMKIESLENMSYINKGVLYIIY